MAGKVAELTPTRSTKTSGCGDVMINVSGGGVRRNHEVEAVNIAGKEGRSSGAH